MKSYNYKIQWLFQITGNFVTPKTQSRRELYTVIRSLGAKSLDKICFRDEDLKVIHTYSNMNMYSYNIASEEAIKYIKKQLKTNDKIYSVELLRK